MARMGGERDQVRPGGLLNFRQLCPEHSPSV